MNLHGLSNFVVGVSCRIDRFRDKCKLTYQFAKIMEKSELSILSGQKRYFFEDLAGFLDGFGGVMPWRRRTIAERAGM